MTVSVASRHIHRLSALSEPARLVLGLIQGGRDWLEWAIHDPRARYHFDDESALVAGIQPGLHGSPLLLLRSLGLLAGPVKLMTIDPPDLRFLTQMNKGGARDGGAVRLKKIRAVYGLVTQAELAEIPAFLKELGVAGAPVFQAMGFDEQLALHAFLCDEDRLPGPDHREEAATFAVAHAATPLEFVDYFRAYRHYVAAARHLPREPKARMACVGEAIEMLLPLLYNALDCPRVDGLIPPWEVAAAIDEWLMMGRRLGFSRLSQGAQQVIAHTDFPRSDGGEDEARAIVANYLAGAQALLGSAELGRGQIGQDGASCTFEPRSELGTAVVALGAGGIITLTLFSRAVPEEPALPSTSKRRK